MNPSAPRSLDGIRFLEEAHHFEEDVEIELAQDLGAIRWLQQHVEGSPVIVEAHTPEYRLGSRMTMYTGLPGVIGWNWHQRQQRAVTPDSWVWDRVEAVRAFYSDADLEAARAFLAEYDVSYIIVGQLERAYYPSQGLAKFPAGEGDGWRLVYQEREMAIYEVRK
jgi:uncharacterized membrane protein